MSRQPARPAGWPLSAWPTPRLPLAAALAVFLLVAAQVALRVDERSWAARGRPQDMVTLDGHLVEYEWWHVDVAAAVLDGMVPPPSVAGDQNVYRFVPAYLIALLREPLHGYYTATRVAAALAWLAAAAALYALALDVTADRRAALLGALLAATGTGFVGYLGQVDPHPYAYAAAALWLLCLHRAGLGQAADAPAARWGRPVFAGLALCVAGYTMEIAYPLLLLAWLVEGAQALAGRRVAGTLARLAVLTAAFALPYLGFRLLAERAVFPAVTPYNDPLSLVGRNWGEIAAVGPAQWLALRLVTLGGNLLVAFPLPVPISAAAGALAVPWRWRSWAAAQLLVFGAALAVTKSDPREVYFVFPGVYVLAAAGIVRLAGGDAWRRWLVPALSIATVIAITNADLWGRYTLPALWHRP